MSYKIQTRGKIRAYAPKIKFMLDNVRRPKSTALLFTKKKLIAPISGFSNEILCIFAAQGIVNLGVKK